MSETNPYGFSEGPWHFERKYGALRIRGAKEDVLCVREMEYGDTPNMVDRKVYNCQLMAAAPELLKEIEKLTEQLEHIPEMASKNYPTILFRPEDRVRLRALINKARGGK